MTSAQGIELFFQSQKHPQCDANRTIHRCWTADHQKGCFMAVCDHQRWLVWKTPQFCTHNGNQIHKFSAKPGNGMNAPPAEIE